MKKVFLIDWGLIPCFVLSTCTGIAVHVIGHENNHELWHTWSVLHVISSMLFVMFVICHVKMHQGWYKGFLKCDFRKKSPLTVIVSLMFILVSLTGLFLLGVSGMNSAIGLWHYKMGLTSSLLSLGHIAVRWPLLRKAYVPHPILQKFRK